MPEYWIPLPQSEKAKAHRMAAAANVSALNREPEDARLKGLVHYEFGKFGPPDMPPCHRFVFEHKEAI